MHGLLPRWRILPIEVSDMTIVVAACYSECNHATLLRAIGACLVHDFAGRRVTRTTSCC